MAKALNYERLHPAAEDVFKRLSNLHMLMGSILVIASLLHLFACFLVALSDNPAYSPTGFTPRFAAAGGSFLVLGVATVVSGRMIRSRRHRTFSSMVAALDCVFIPFGTVFGVYAIRTMQRKDVIAGYSSPSPPLSTPNPASLWDTRRAAIRDKSDKT